MYLDDNRIYILLNVIDVEYAVTFGGLLNAIILRVFSSSLHKMSFYYNHFVIVSINFSFFFFQAAQGRGCTQISLGPDITDMGDKLDTWLGKLKGDILVSGRS